MNYISKNVNEHDQSPQRWSLGALVKELISLFLKLVIILEILIVNEMPYVLLYGTLYYAWFLVIFQIDYEYDTLASGHIREATMNLEGIILAHTGMRVTKTVARNCDSYDHEKLELDIHIKGKFLKILWINVSCPCEGVGTKIIEALKEYCKNNCLDLMAANVLTDVIPFWVKMGFQPSEELEANYVLQK